MLLFTDSKHVSWKWWETEIQNMIETSIGMKSASPETDSYSKFFCLFNFHKILYRHNSNPHVVIAHTIAFRWKEQVIFSGNNPLTSHLGKPLSSSTPSTITPLVWGLHIHMMVILKKKWAVPWKGVRGYICGPLQKTLGN